MASRLGVVFSASVSDLLASDLLSAIMDHFCFLFGLSRIISCSTNAFLTFADTACGPISMVIRQCHNNANHCLAKILRESSAARYLLGKKKKRKLKVYIYKCLNSLTLIKLFGFH